MNNGSTAQPVSRRAAKRLAIPTFVGVLVAGAIVVQTWPADPVNASSQSTYQPVATTAAAKTSATARATAAAKTFLATLSTSQRATAQFSFTDAKKTTGWSNLPTAMVARNGLEVKDMSAKQLSALKALLRATLSTQGYSQEQAIRVADDYLNTLQATGQGKTAPTGGGGTPPTGTPPAGATPPTTTVTPTATTPSTTTTQQYGSGLYYIAFFGSPSNSKKWMLQFGGHHLAINETFDGATISGTPYFVGVEPLSFTVASKGYAPLKPASDAMTALFQSLSPTELAAAKLPSTFDDVLLGPGQDGKFPTREGQSVADLSAAQKKLLTTAIGEWVNNVTPAAAKKLMATYAKGYSQTKIAYATSIDPTVQGSYMRIDGPKVWIEIVSQGGIVTSNIHYHSIWRDRGSDYGA